MKQKIMALVLASVMMLQGVTAGAAEISLADVSESEMPGISGMQPEVQPELIEPETEALSGQADTIGEEEPAEREPDKTEEMEIAVVSDEPVEPTGVQDLSDESVGQADVQDLSDESVGQADVQDLSDESVEQADVQDPSARAAGVAINETNFPDKVFREYIARGYDDDKDGMLSPEEIENTTGLWLSGQSEIRDLKGIEYFSALEYLDCRNLQLKELDVSKNSALTNLDCSFNQLTELDVSKNPALTDLSCSSNQLAELDISKNPALTDLSCSFNQLTELDTSKNPVLAALRCEENQLVRLDISGSPELTYLACGGNKLTGLKLDQNKALETISCGSNQLTELDVSGNPALKDLSCNSNQLTKLDFSSNPALKELFCGKNQLTKLDFSSNPALERVTCWDNQLTELDFSNNPELTLLHCERNQLTSLNLDKNLLLTTLSFGENHLTHWNTNGQKISGGNSGDPQTVTATVVQKDGKYQLDLAELVGSENVERVTVTPLYSRDYRMEQNGSVLIFTAMVPEKISYEYRTGIEDVLIGKDEGGAVYSKYKMVVDVALSKAACNHEFGPYVTTTAPTVFTEGTASRTCKTCGEVQTKTIEKLKGTIKLTVSKLPLQVKKSISAKSLVTGLQAGDSIDTWKSADTKIASVNKNGKITGKKSGTTKIQVILKSGASAALKVTVQKKEVKTTGISGLEKKISLAVGEKKTLKPVIVPASSQQKVTYQSSNKKVVSVNAKGVIKGRKKGKAKITVTSGSKKFNIEVKVTKK